MQGTTPKCEEIRKVDHFDFLQSGHIDSMGVMRFALDIEKEFDIEFADEEIASPQFRIVPGLSEMIKEKIH